MSVTLRPSVIPAVSHADFCAWLRALGIEPDQCHTLTLKPAIGGGKMFTLIAQVSMRRSADNGRIISDDQIRYEQVERKVYFA